MNIEPEQLEQLWDDLLSRQPDHIRAAFASLDAPRPKSCPHPFAPHGEVKVAGNLSKKLLPKLPYRHWKLNQDRKNNGHHPANSSDA